MSGEPGEAPQSAMELAALAARQARELLWSFAPGQFYCNPAWEALTGRTAAELRALGLPGLARDEDRKRLAWQLENALQRGAPVETEFWCETPSGAVRLRVDGQPVFDGGRCVALAGSCTRSEAPDERLAALFDEVPVGVVAADALGQLTYVNPAWRRMTGLDLETTRQWRADALVHPDDLAAMQERFSAGGSTAIARLRTASGEYRWHLVIGTPGTANGGTTREFIGLQVDIHDEYLAQRGVQEALERVQALLDHVPAKVLITGPESHWFANREARDSIRGTLDDLREWQQSGVVHPEDAPAFASLIARARETGEPIDLELRIRDAGGEYRWHRWQSRNAPLPGGEVARVAVAIDVHDRRRAEEALTAERRAFEAFTDNLPVMAWDADPTGRLRYINRTARLYVGEEQARASITPADFVHPDDLPAAIALVQESHRAGRPWQYECRFRRADGEYRWHIVRGRPALDAAGRVVRWFGTATDIHDRRKMEEALQLSEATARGIAESIQAFVWRREHGRTVHLNSRWSEYTGLREDEAGALGWMAAVHPEDRERVVAAAQQSLLTGEALALETRMRRFDGVYRWFLVRSVRAAEGEGDDAPWVGTAVDIDDLKEAESRARESAERLRDLAASIDAMVIIRRPGSDGRRVTEFLNDRWSRYTGLSAEAADDAGWLEAVHPDDRERALATRDRQLSRGEPVVYEYRLRGADGQYRWFLVRQSPRNERGESVLVAVDIHERKLTEQALQESETRSRLLAEAVDAFVWVQREGRVAFLNRRWEEYSGQSLAEPESTDDVWRRFTHPADRRKVRRVFDRFLETGTTVTVQQRFRRHDGEYRWFLVRLNALEMAGPRVRAWVGTAVDIHDQVTAEQAAMQAMAERTEALALLDSFFANSSAGMAFFDRDLRYQRVNPALAEMNGVPLEEHIGRTPAEVLPDAPPELLAEVARVARNGVAAPEFEVTAESARGRRHFLESLFPVRDGEGRMLGVGAVVLDISERKRIEQALARAREERLEALALFEALLNNAPVGIAFVDRELRIRHINESLAKLDGLPVEDHLGRTVSELGVVHASVRASQERVLEHGIPILNQEATGPGGRTVLNSYFPVRDASGDVLGVGMVVTDISDRKAVEEALANLNAERAEALALLETLLANAPVAFALLDREWRYVRVNDMMAGFNGAPAEAHLGRMPSELPGFLDAQAFDAFREVLWSGEPILNLEVRGEPGEGDAGRIFLASFYPVRALDGGIAGVGVLATDITDRKRAEEAMGQLAAIVESSGDAIVSLDREGKVLTWNRGAQQLFGWTAEEAIGQHVSFITPPEAELQRQALFARALAGEAVPPVEAVRQAKDGHRVDVLLTMSPVRDASGTVCGVSATLRDIGASKRATMALRESEARYRSLIDSIPAKVCIIDPSDNVQFYNPAWTDYTGVPEAEMLRQSLYTYIHPDDRERVRAWWQEARLGGNAPEQRLRFLGRGGEYRWHLVRGVAVRDAEGQVAYWIGVAVDIDAIVRAEQALIAANEAKDEFLGLVSHELRTPLTQVYGNADILLRLHDRLSAEDRQGSLRDIHEQAMRLQRMVENMLTLAVAQGNAEVELEPVLIQRLLPRVVAEQAARLTGREVTVEVEADLPPVMAEASYIDQIVGNLISNATKYSPAGTPITIAAKRAGDEIEVAVLDRGRGVSDDELSRLFEPFFRSSATAVLVPGLGLGLSVCKRFVDALGGRMWARRRDGGGMAFGFSIPITAEVIEE